MSSIYELQCNECDFKQSFWSLYGAHFYRLTNDLEIPILIDTGWCDQCNKVVMAEKLLSTAEIESELERCGVGKKYALGWWGENGYWRSLRMSLLWSNKSLSREAYILAVQSIREWRKTRRCPPKCLSCSSVHVQSIPIESAFPHPRCSGLISCTEFFMASTVWDIKQYSAEGELIANAE